MSKSRELLEKLKALSPSGGTGISTEVAQVAHGFNVGQFVGITNGGFVLATNITDYIPAIGMVTEVIDVDNFKIQSIGEVTTVESWNVGDTYFLGENGGYIDYYPENAQGLFTAIGPNKIYLNIGDMFVGRAAEENNFIITINLPSNGISITLPFGVGFNVNALVDWGDGTVTNPTTYNSVDATHTYTTAGVYTISIQGVMESLLIDNTTPIYEYIETIENWGLTDLQEITFTDCLNLTIVPRDSDNSLVSLISVDSLFKNCASLSYIPQGLFDYAINVTTFASAFENCTGLSGTIPAELFKNTSSVTDFTAIFKNCTSLTGNAPEIWVTYSGATGTEAFNGDNFDNQASIPVGWK